MELFKCVQKTKARLDYLKGRRKSLKELCAEYIEKNPDIISSSNVNLPFHLRNEILESFSQQRSTPTSINVEEFEKRAKILEFLLTKFTKKLDISGVLSFCPVDVLSESLTKLIRALSSHATNLQELNINREASRREDGENKGAVFYVSESLEAALASISKLKSLKLGSPFMFRDFSQLASLCSRLPYLEVVYANLNQMGNSLINNASLESCFPSLISYHFPIISIQKKCIIEMYSRLDKICCTNAESLRSVYVSETRVSCRVCFQRTFYTGSPGNFRKVTLVADSRGRMMFSRFGWDRSVFDKYYTSDFSCKEEEMVSATDASSASTPITSFYYVVYSKESYLDILQQLEHIGKELHTLIVESGTHYAALMENTDLSSILNLCPKLERIVFGFPIYVDELSLNHQFTHLRELQLDSFKYSDSNPTALERMVAAPNLERLSLKVGYGSLRAGALNALKPLIADNTILRKLHTMEITVQIRVTKKISKRQKRGRFTSFLRIEEETTSFNWNEMATFLKTASCFLPNLSDLRCKVQLLFLKGDQFCEHVSFQIGRNNRKFEIINGSSNIDIESHERKVIYDIESNNLEELLILY